MMLSSYVLLLLVGIIQRMNIIEAFPDGNAIPCAKNAAQVGHNAPLGDIAAGGGIFKIDENILDPLVPILLPIDTTVTISLESPRTIGILFHMAPSDTTIDLTGRLQPVGDLLKVMASCAAPLVSVIHSTNDIKDVSSVTFDTTGLTGTHTLSLSHLVANLEWYYGEISLTIAEVVETDTPTLTPVAVPETDEPTRAPVAVEPTATPVAVLDTVEPTATPVAVEPTATPSATLTPAPSVTVSTSSFKIKYSAPDATEPSDAEYGEVNDITLSYLFSLFSNYFESQRKTQKIVVTARNKTSITIATAKSNVSQKAIALIELYGEVAGYVYDPTETNNIIIEWDSITILVSSDSDEDDLPTSKEMTLLLEEYILSDLYQQEVLTLVSATNPFILTESVIIETELTPVEPSPSPSRIRSPRAIPAARPRRNNKPK